MNITTKANLFL